MILLKKQPQNYNIETYMKTLLKNKKKENKKRKRKRNGLHKF